MGGKSSSPAAPDYVGQAQAQSAGNLNAARSTTAANRIDQSTPYGSINYTQGDGFDQAGFDEATKKYQAQEASLAANPQVRAYMQATGALQAAPDRTSFITNPDHWQSQINLSDTGQQLLDQYNRTSLGMAGLQDQAMSRVSNSFDQPFDSSGIPGTQYGVDMSGLGDVTSNVDPATGMAAWDRATDLIRQRQNPQLDAQQAALDTKLANQGLTAGSEGWGIQQQNFGRTRNDADIAAQMAGLQAQQQFFGQALSNANLNNASQAQRYGQAAGNVQMNNAGRASELQQRATLRNIPLNELNALRTGSQVTNPTFSTPGQQGQTSGPDLLGATNSQYQAQVGQANAQNAQSAQETQAAASAAAAGIAAWGSYAGAAGSFF